MKKFRIGSNEKTGLHFVDKRRGILHLFTWKRLKDHRGMKEYSFAEAIQVLEYAKHLKKENRKGTITFIYPD